MITEGHADPHYKWKVFGCVMFGVFMVVLDTTVVNVAFPTLRAEFDASLNDAQWIVSIYVLALGMSTPLAGYMLALGTAVQTTFATAFGSVPRGRLARGSALIYATRNVVQSIGVAVLATVLASAGSKPLIGFENAYGLTFYVSLLAVAIALFLPGWPGPWSGREGLQAVTAA